MKKADKDKTPFPQIALFPPNAKPPISEQSSNETDPAMEFMQDNHLDVI